MRPAKAVVLHIITLLEMGGAQGNTIYTVRHLPTDRFETHLWTGKGAYWDRHVIHDLGPARRLRFFRFLVRELNPLFDLIALFQLWIGIRKLRPAIVHTHSSKAGILGRLAAVLAGVPIIIHTVHGFGFNDRQSFFVRSIFIALEKLTARFSTKLIFVSEANRDEATRRGIGNPEQFALIRSGILTAAVRAAAEKSGTEVVRELELPKGSRLVTTIGAFKPQKNLIDFVRLAARVAREVPEAAFVILGDGALRPQLERAVRENGLESRLRMPGWREDAPRILAASRVYAMTSLWEGLPRALVEALILGIPSVCYNADGVRDLLRRGGGVLVPRYDVEAAAAAVATLLTGQNAHTKCSQTARALIGDEFDIDVMVRRQAQLYDDLLSQPQKR